jgi:hypothetical protein
VTSLTENMPNCISASWATLFVKHICMRKHISSPQFNRSARPEKDPTARTDRA